MGVTILISRAVLDAIDAAAEATGTLECCGLLLGEAGHVREARAAANVADDSAKHFEIDPAVLIAAHRAQRDGGPAILGCYHSHPGGDPSPSPTDARQAEASGQLWLIRGAGGELRLWRAVRDGTVHDRFDPVEFMADPAS